MSEALLAFEFDLWDRANNVQKTLRLCNEGPLLLGSGSSRDQFLPRLIPPVFLGSRISAETYTPPFREVPNGGSVKFAMDEAIWPWLDYSQVGRVVRGYLGEVGDKFEDMELVFNGRIASPGITHDTITGNIPLTDARVDLDDVLVPTLYPDTALESIRGLPMPELYGTCYSVAPVLEDEPNQIWRVSRLPLSQVIALRVGGIPWRYTSGIPAQGQWTVFLSEGKIQLGSPTNGAELRVDARGVGWETMTTAQLLRTLVSNAGKLVDADAMTALDRAAPGLIGWYTTTDPINRLDAFDQILGGIVGWWGLKPTGEVTAGVIQAPSSTADISADRIRIMSLALAQVLPPVWRLRVEYMRNWQPLSQVLEGNLTDAEKQAFKSTGIVLDPYTNEGVKTSDPLAVDAPLIRSLLVNQIDAAAVRDRAAVAWGSMRKLYEATAFIDDPQLYETAAVDYDTVTGNFRAHGAVRALGGTAPAQLQWWG